MEKSQGGVYLHQSSFLVKAYLFSWRMSYGIPGDIQSLLPNSAGQTLPWLAIFFVQVKETLRVKGVLERKIQLKIPSNDSIFLRRNRHQTTIKPLMHIQIMMAAGVEIAQWDQQVYDQNVLLANPQMLFPKFADLS